MKKWLIYLLVILLLLGSGIFVTYYFSHTTVPAQHSASVEAQITYPGKDGQNAFALLDMDHTVGLDSSGLVSSIDARKADAGKHEYWAFYVNGELASVGPKEYVTKSTDQIMWKIETY